MIQTTELQTETRAHFPSKKMVFRTTVLGIVGVAIIGLTSLGVGIAQRCPNMDPVSLITGFDVAGHIFWTENLLAGPILYLSEQSTENQIGIGFRDAIQIEGAITRDAWNHGSETACNN